MTQVQTFDCSHIPQVYQVELHRWFDVIEETDGKYVVLHLN